ncbi:MAG TPA: DEAD/DEAH box helicase [Verrucomicrobiae bacterium]|nr:DEAD/DEAH box helicase [Verrucomicrobiae bacterium]
MRTTSAKPSWTGVVESLGGEGRVVLDHWEPARPAHYGPIPDGLEPRLVAALRRRGITQLYRHQSAAVAAALSGRHLAIVTPTASGKTLCYNLPVLSAVLADDTSRALYLFPTKALAQDQLVELQTLADAAEMALRTHTYDGDTPPGVRAALRDAGHVILTNPEMLHTGILPHHTRWVRLFESLRYVVVDELHTYRGVFGSHVANVIRRLQRICDFYGSRPTFLACSATIANPAELAERLLGRDVDCIDDNGAPAPPKRLVVWNPPVVQAALGIRRSAALEARRVVPELVRRGAQTIVFGRTRLQVELLLTYLRRGMAESALVPDGAGGPPVRAYRGGYLPLERRAIEAGLRDGSVRCVVATSALELGIDIGQMEAAVLVGYPGTIASTWQQLGRAGRRGRPALQLLIVGGGPLDQYVATHPEFLLEQPPEQALVNPDNLLILAAHVQAATFELPFHDGERFGGVEIADLLRLLAEEGVVHHAGGRWHWSADAFPAEAISLRTVASSNIVIIDTSSPPARPSAGPQGPWAGSGGGHAGTGARIVGEIDEWAAPLTVHDDAIYLHQGRQFHVERLDWEERRAYVHPVAVDYYTEAEVRVHLQVLECYAGPDTCFGQAAQRAHGDVRVSWLAAMYRKVRFLTHETVGAGPIALPERDLHTTAYWCGFPAAVTRRAGRAVEPGLHGLAHVLEQVATLTLMCDRRDLGVSAQVRAPVDRLPVAEQVQAAEEFVAGHRPPAVISVSRETAVGSEGQPTIFLYDAHPGGTGLAPRCFELHTLLLARAGELLRRCPCPSGCPACVGAVAGVDPQAKAMALALLDAAALGDRRCDQTAPVGGDGLISTAPVVP